MQIFDYLDAIFMMYSSLIVSVVYSKKLKSLPDDEGGVDLQSVRSECRVLEKLNKLLDISLSPNVWQVCHHGGMVTYTF